MDISYVNSPIITSHVHDKVCIAVIRITARISNRIASYYRGVWAVMVCFPWKVGTDELNQYKTSHIIKTCYLSHKEKDLNFVNNIFTRLNITCTTTARDQSLILHTTTYYIIMLVKLLFYITRNATRKRIIKITKKEDSYFHYKIYCSFALFKQQHRSK